jgi:hypothetical protein
MSTSYPCRCGCGGFARSKSHRWIAGHHEGEWIKPAGITLERAMEIALGATPRMVEREVAA